MRMHLVRDGLIAAGVAALASLARWVFECRFVVSLVPDAQSAIWIVMSTITSGFVFATLTVAALVMLRGLKSHRVFVRVVACMPLLGSDGRRQRSAMTRTGSSRARSTAAAGQPFAETDVLTRRPLSDTVTARS
jgi:hypothetical protein